MLNLFLFVLAVHMDIFLIRTGIMYIKGMKKIKMVKESYATSVKLYNRISKWDIISLFLFVIVTIPIYFNIMHFSDEGIDVFFRAIWNLCIIVMLLQSIINFCICIGYGQYSYLTKGFFASTEGEFLKKDCTFMITQTNNNVYELLIYERNKEMPRVFVITEKHREAIEMINEHYPKRTTVTGISHDEYSL